MSEPWTEMLGLIATARREGWYEENPRWGRVDELLVVMSAPAMSAQEEELRRQIIMHIHAEDELATARRFIGALLAVAKAAREEVGRDLYYMPDTRRAFEALDAKHPGWREWAP